MSDILSDSEIAEIEARAKAASPRYVIDWEKGHHGWIREAGYRPADEPQPRIIAEFDKDVGYRDLEFCAESRTDIPHLIASHRALAALVYVPKILADDETLTYQDYSTNLLRRHTEAQERIRTLESACEAARKLFVGLVPELDRAEDVEAVIKRLEGAIKHGE